MDVLPRALLLVTLTFASSAGPGAAAHANDPGLQLAQLSAGAVGPPPPAPASVDDERALTFDERVANFLRRFYLTGAPLSLEEMEALYAPRVDYFDQRKVARARVLADKFGYFKRWPDRMYVLQRETLKIRSISETGKIFDVTFRYTYEVSSGDRVSKGLGFAQLTLDLTFDGRITRETGKILKRWK